MSKKELKRVEVIAQLEAGVVKTRQASDLLGLSERQVKRLRKANRIAGWWFRGTLRTPILVDGRELFNQRTGLTYYGIGRGNI